jgi:hypothetical protein
MSSFKVPHKTLHWRGLFVPGRLDIVQMPGRGLRKPATLWLSHRRNGPENRLEIRGLQAGTTDQSATDFRQLQDRVRV